MKTAKQRWAPLVATDRQALLLLLFFAVLAAAYGLSNPLFEATDEIRHFRYVRYLQTERTLPPLTETGSGTYQAHHPPLYYTLVALVSTPVASDISVSYTPDSNPYWGYRYFEVSADNKMQYLHLPAERFPGRNGFTTVWLGRLVSLLFGLGAVWLTYRLARLLYSDRPMVALGAMAIVGFNPMFLHLSASLVNDSIAAFFGAAVVLASAHIWQAGLSSRRALWLALALGLGMLSKATVYPLALPAAVVVLAGWWQARNRQTMLAALVFAVVTGVLAGPWFVRNLVLTGDLLGSGEYTSAWLADGTDLVGNFIASLPYTWSTLFVRFNYGQIPAHGWLYVLGTVVLLAGLAGLLLRRVKVPWLLSSSLLLVIAAWVYLMLTVPATNSARMLFPAFAALGVMLAAGLLPQQSPRRAAWLLPFGTAALAVWALAAYLHPAYAYPPRVSVPQSPVASCEGAVATMTHARIVGPTTGLKPGDTVDISATWQPQQQTGAPLSVFVHLIDQDGILLAQRDTWPGLGRAPTTQWQAPFSDTYRITIPASAYTPASVTVVLGLWQPDTGERPVIASADGCDSEVAVGGLSIAAVDSTIPNRLSANFHNVIELRGYQLDTRTVRPGETVELTTYWWLETPMTEVYNVFAHVVGADGRVWAIADSMMLPPSTEWPVNELRLEIRTITLPADIPPGEYALEFGLWRNRNDNMERLRILYPDGRQIADYLLLTRIRVVGE